MTWFGGRRWLPTASFVKAAGWSAMRPLGFTWGDWFIGAMRFKRHDWSKGDPLE